MRPLRVLTWHIHGSYLYYLCHTPVEFYVLSKPERGPGYLGRWGHFPWRDNVHDMPVERLAESEFDCVLFQSREHYLKDQHEILTDAQRRLPKIYLEHDPPRADPTATRHPVDDPDTLLVHVTHFNDLMWDSGRTPTRVIRHGVTVPAGVRYSGELARGIVVINHLARRGRRLGRDVYERVLERVPLDLFGMGAEEMPGGGGEIRHSELAAAAARYRFFFNPIRYTSLGLAVCEAMMTGLPVIGLATTEMAVAVENGVSGFVHTDVAALSDYMEYLLRHPEEAQRLSRGARRAAQEQFGIQRFAADWLEVFREATG